MNPTPQRMKRQEVYKAGLKDKDAGTVSIEGTETIDDLGFVEVEPDADSLQQAIVELFYKEYN